MSVAFSKLIRALAVIVGSLVIFFTAQLLGVVALGMVLAANGWDADRIAEWLSNTTTGQFLAVLFVEFFTVLGVWIVLKKRGRSSVPAQLRLKPTVSKPDIMAVVSGFALYFGISFIVRLMTDYLIPAVDLDQQQQIGFENVAGPALALVFVALCIAVPIGEEILFRGLFFSGLKRFSSYHISLVLTSVIFGLAHLEFLGDAPLNWAAAIDTAVFSIVLIWVYEKRGNLWAAIGLHGLKNFIAFLLLFVFKV